MSSCGWFILSSTLPPCVQFLYGLVCLLGWRDPVRSQCWLALAGLLVAALSAVAGLGICAVIGLPFNVLTIQVGPWFLIMPLYCRWWLRYGSPCFNILHIFIAPTRFSHFCWWDLAWMEFSLWQLVTIVVLLAEPPVPLRIRMHPSHHRWYVSYRVRFVTSLICESRLLRFHILVFYCSWFIGCDFRDHIRPSPLICCPAKVFKLQPSNSLPCPTKHFILMMNVPADTRRLMIK